MSKYAKLLSLNTQTADHAFANLGPKTISPKSSIGVINRLPSLTAKILRFQTKFISSNVHTILGYNLPTFPKAMPAKSHKPRFQHRPVRGMKERVESYCTLCKKFVAASDKAEALRIAEKAHVCPRKHH